MGVRIEGGRLDRKTRHHRLAGGNPAENTAGLVAGEGRRVPVAGAHFIRVFLAGQSGCGKACADLDALDRIDRHQRRGDLGIELAIDRRTQTRRHALGHDLDDGSDRGAGFADAVEIIGVECGGLRIGAERTGLRAISSQSQLPRSIACGPICTSAPRTRRPGTTLRAMAPAATRAAVSRAEERPPPR